MHGNPSICYVMDIFKIQSANVVRTVGALATLEWRQKRIRIFPPEMLNCQAYPRLWTRSNLNLNIDGHCLLGSPDSNPWTSGRRTKSPHTDRKH